MATERGFVKPVFKRLRWYSLLILLLLAAVFIVQNAAVVELQFFHITVEARRAFIVGASILLGGVVGWLFGVTSRR